MESQKQIQELAPVRTEFVQVNYAKACEIANCVPTSKRRSENPPTCCPSTAPLSAAAGLKPDMAMPG